MKVLGVKVLGPTLGDWFSAVTTALLAGMLAFPLKTLGIVSSWHVAIAFVLSLAAVLCDSLGVTAADHGWRGYVIVLAMGGLAFAICAALLFTIH